MDAAYELLDRFERELGLSNSRGGGAIDDKEAEKCARKEVGLQISLQSIRLLCVSSVGFVARETYCMVRVSSGCIEQELARIKRVLAGVALRRWMHKSMGQAWSKWREELWKKCLVGRMVVRWANRLLSRTWVAWEFMMTNQKRLQAIVAKCIGRWKFRAQARAWES